MNSHSDHTLHFEAVNSRNRAEVEHLEVFAEQSGFIESVTVPSGGRQIGVVEARRHL